MQCHSCNALLLDGTTTCPACGAIPQPDESKSPYELDDEAIPFIDYPGHKAASTSAPVLQPARSSYEASTGIPSSPQQPVAQHIQPHRGISAGVAALLVVLAFLLVGGSGFGYYLAKVQPAELNAQATSVVQNILAAQVQATTQTIAAFTAQPPQKMYAQVTSRKPDFSDPLDTQENSWINYTSPNFGCAFIGGAYHATAILNDTYSLCISPDTNYSNFAFQVRMILLRGDSGGLLFRMDSKHGSFYRFTIDRGGNYYLYFHASDNSVTLLTRGLSPTIYNALLQSPSQAVVTTVIAYTSHIYLFVNGQFLAQVNNDKIASGPIGLTALSTTQPTEVAFTNAQLWIV